MIYSESDLIIPTLNYLLLHKVTGLKTSDLINSLTKEFKLSGRDAKILTGRNDTYFSQKVRNLVSHRTLERKSLATYEKIGRDGLHKITEAGEKYLFENFNNFTFILDNNFSERQRENIIKRDYSNLVIEEGFAIFSQIKTKQRSKKLALIAKKHFSHNGKIYCSACNFNFENFYGEVGKGFIEIHHLKPVFAIENNFEKSIVDALKGVVPLCANCHRIIHRKNDNLLSIPSLQKLINVNGIYKR